LLDHVDGLSGLNSDVLVKKRYERLMQFGTFTARRQ
jgi:hypothetical protein